MSEEVLKAELRHINEKLDDIKKYIERQGDVRKDLAEHTNNHKWAIGAIASITTILTAIGGVIVYLINHKG